MENLKYKRILLKISGEALLGEQQFGIDYKPVEFIAEEIKQIHEMGVEVAVVVGGGNIFRGMKNSARLGMDRASGDYLGMLATVMNALAIQDKLEQLGVPVRVQTALTITKVAEPYILRKAIRHFEKGRIVIFACGTGNPYFSTDTGAALRACEIGADALLLAKNVDGVYDSDPKLNPTAKKFSEISYMDVIQKGLKAMDTTAITMCMDNNIPIVVFALMQKDSIRNAVYGVNTGTIIH